MVQIEVTQERTVANMSRIYRESHVMNRQYPLNAHVRNFQRIEIPGLDLPKNASECSPKGGLIARP
jgi:hypothetical protein